MGLRGRRHGQRQQQEAGRGEPRPAWSAHVVLLGSPATPARIPLPPRPRYHRFPDQGPADVRGLSIRHLSTTARKAQQPACHAVPRGPRDLEHLSTVGSEIPTYNRPTVSAAQRNRTVNEHSLALAREWKKLGRAATAVALLTSPIVFAVFVVSFEWSRPVVAARGARGRRRLPRRRRRARAQADPDARDLRRGERAADRRHHEPAAALVLEQEVPPRLEPLRWSSPSRSASRWSCWRSRASRSSIGDGFDADDRRLRHLPARDGELRADHGCCSSS